MRFCLLILNLSFDIYVFELNLSFGKFCKSSRTKDSKAFSILCLFERVEPSLKLASLVINRFNLSNVQFLVICWLQNEKFPSKMISHSFESLTIEQITIKIEQTSNVVTSAIFRGSSSSQAPEVSKMKIPANIQLNSARIVIIS